MSSLIRTTKDASWPNSYLLQPPVQPKQLKEPRVLVKRDMPEILGPREEELIYLPGNPSISLFTGAGGMDIGTEQAGFCTLVQHEWDMHACNTLIGNRPGYFPYAALIQGDIKETPTSMILGEAGLRVGETHLLTGGPPCQGFSIGNTNTAKGKYDERNDLVFEYLRVVREAQPKFFVFENVPGFVSFNKHEYLKAFLVAAHDCYYELVYGLIDCVEYGVPQHRTRFICMGTRRDLVDIEGILGSLPEPQNFAEPDLEAIKVVEHKPLFIAEYERLTRPPGIRYFTDRPILIPPHPTNKGRRSKKFMDFYDRLEREEPDRIVKHPHFGRAA